MGIEPTSSAWKAEVLPLNYTRRIRVSCHLLCGGGGRIYSGHPALRPPGRRAARGVRNRSRRFREPPSVLILPLSNKRKIPNIWWRGEDLNLRRLSRQIYSLIPLTAREPLQKCKPAIVLQTLLRVNRYTRVAASQAVRWIQTHSVGHENHCTPAIGHVKTNASPGTSIIYRASRL
jgi:hypothetical protein